MPHIKSVREADIAGKRVLLRVDFNVMQEGTITGDLRIKAAVPTIQFLLDGGAGKIIIITHIGRPEGSVVEELRVAPVAARLKELVDDPRIEVRENLRFDPREDANDEGYAKELATLGDIYVNDAFAVSHRACASIVGIPKFLPSYAGILMKKEISKLSEALTPPAGSVALIGGVKGETKIPLIEKLSKLYDKVFIGGAIANDFKPSSQNEIVPTDGVPKLGSMLDVGPQTAERWAAEVTNAPFVLWNGPLGWYEKGFRESTDTIARAIVNGNAKAVIGGGDTVAVLAHYRFDAERMYLSTGGGAMLQFLADGTLPGIEALKR